jgi:hypothetical protein
MQIPTIANGVQLGRGFASVRQANAKKHNKGEKFFHDRGAAAGTNEGNNTTNSIQNSNRPELRVGVFDKLVYVFDDHIIGDRPRLILP